MKKSLSDWLHWQETLNPREIDLGLDRVRRVFDRLAPQRPRKGVITVGGTNGKGSTVRFIEALCIENGLTTAVYTSPHLVRYNERIVINRQEVTDEWLIRQFETVDRARQGIPLTYFEFGTLAALAGFSELDADIWILEVGLGGRLDAVNVVDPDVSLVTTISLEHQDWLGDTIDLIAAEKAGILRAGRPAFYGDEPVPEGLAQAAQQIGAQLACFGTGFGYRMATEQHWDWYGPGCELTGLSCPAVDDPAQYRNISLGLCAMAAIAPNLLSATVVNKALQWSLPHGRFEIVERDRQWIVDVAHNPQAAQVLSGRLASLDDQRPLLIVLGMLADKQADEFVTSLAAEAARWIVSPVADRRSFAVEQLVAAVRSAGGEDIVVADSPRLAIEMAHSLSNPGDRILVTGSFHIVGPALSWLGLY